MEDGNDTGIPVRMRVVGFLGVLMSDNHDVGVRRRIDDILRSLHVVCCIVDTQGLVEIDPVCVTSRATATPIFGTSFQLPGLAPFPGRIPFPGLSTVLPNSQNSGRTSGPSTPELPNLRLYFICLRLRHSLLLAP